jgi:hypothetical protein
MGTRSSGQKNSTGLEFIKLAYFDKLSTSDAIAHASDVMQTIGILGQLYDWSAKP